MTAATDPGVDFWVQYVTAEGGLHEATGGGTLVLLPETLQERHHQDAEMTVTADPDIAREDRAMLMTVGHPLLTAAAETVLDEGDVGAVRLPRPTKRPPDIEQLQAWARDRFTVDHGRVDLIGGPRPGVRHLVRVSSLATFAMSTDDRFQEQIESWVDVPTGLPLGDGVGRVLSDLVAIEHAERDHLDPNTPGLARALVAVDAEIGRRAESRRQALGDGVLPAFLAETDRARDYYEQMAQSLRKRMSAAQPDKVAGYQARLEHCHAERDRRLAEIEEKYRSSVQFRPFRLHLVGVPSLRVEAGIRRGNRWYPVDLEWLSPVRRFAPLACPGCGSGAELVAGKAGLGCRVCQPPRQLESVPEPTQNRRTPAPVSKPAAPVAPDPAPVVVEPAQVVPERARPEPARPDHAEKPAGRNRAAGRNEPGGPGRADRTANRRDGGSRGERSPAGMSRTGSKLVVRLWERVECGDGTIAGMLAPEGPAAALVRVAGAFGPRAALGLPDALRLMTVSTSSSAAVAGTDLWLTTGRLGASDRMEHPFQVAWHMVNGRPLIDEIVGVATGVWPWLPGRPYLGGAHPGLWDLPLTPRRTSTTRSDPVAGLLLDVTVRCQGVAIAARCLAAWWRLDRDVAAELVEVAGPEVVAAALDRLVSKRASTARRGELDVSADYRADLAGVKSMTGRLQRRLSLGPTRPW